jgi:hypothetical protein
MDGSRFDAWSRTLVTAHSRRGLTRLLVGLAVGGPLAGLGRSETAAKPKRRKKKHQRPTSPPPPVSPPPPPCPDGQRLCRGSCLSLLVCCDNADCLPAGGRTCQNGTCACPPDKPRDDCPGSNTVCQECCRPEECQELGDLDGSTCVSGQCVCTNPTTRRCPVGTAWAGVCGQCCDNAECSGGQRCLSTFGPPSCGCPDDASCNGVCVPMPCAGMCGQVCSTVGASCCGNGALTCQATLGEPLCLPPPG